MKKLIIIFLVYGLWSIVQGEEGVYAQDDIGNYLILEPIGEFKFGTANRVEGAGGILAPVGHFPDHTDVTYSVPYSNRNPDRNLRVVVRVSVTLHSGSESDRWLLHEVEDIFRSNERLGEMSVGTEIREIDGNKIYNLISYAWVSGNKVVYITWTPKPNVQNPEPLEVVRAYLQKFPSSITLTDAEVKSKAHNEQWLKDEMERRIWLSEKWIALIKAQSKVDELSEVRKHLEVFMKYREKYLGVKVTDKEINALYRAEEKKDVVGMEGIVKGYREWWESNKTKALQNVPGNCAE